MVRVPPTSVPRLVWTVFLAVLRGIGRVVADLLAPPTCAACDLRILPRTLFCRACAASVVETARVDWASGVRVLSAAGYGGALAVTIRRLKYGSRPDLAGALAEVVRRAVRATGLDVDVIVPVPLHRARRIERGYNQSALLASRIAREVGARVAYRALRRSTRTGPQVGLDRAARLANVRAAFVVRAPAEIDGRRILLVDDVCTTGATLAACAEALRAAGAREVVAIVVARALTDEDASPVAPSTNGL